MNLSESTVAALIVAAAILGAAVIVALAVWASPSEREVRAENRQRRREIERHASLAVRQLPYPPVRATPPLPSQPRYRADVEPPPRVVRR